MNIINKLEQKFPWFGFPNLNLYMVVILLLGLAIYTINPQYYFVNLSLNFDKILSGEVYRIVTFIFYPISSGIFALIMVLVYYSITKTLIMMWGNFKFNLYLFIGYLSHLIGGLINYLVFKQSIAIPPIYTTFSLIMAFALSFPNALFLVYFFIPIKAKYFAYFEIAIYFISFLHSTIENRIAILCSVVNVFVFFVLLKENKYE